MSEDTPPAEDRTTPVTLELLTLLAAGVADLALDQLRQSADRAQEVLRRSDLRELLTDGVVELRKRGELATRRTGAGADNHLETMARRAAERVAAEGHPVHDHTGFKERIDEVLVRLADEEERTLLGLHAELSPLSEQLRRSLADGKRIRAAFLYWGWRAAGQPDCEGVIRAAAAMELVHAAACTHDDIIDGSTMRHGRLTAHAAFAATGQRSTALAMILGDLLMGYAGHVFSSCGLPGAYLARTVPLWSALLRETMAGEFLEVLRTGTGPAQTARTPQVAESLEVARFKTAKYTVERPLHLGATLGGGSPALHRVFSAYGLPLGEAFQLRDDLLGTFGDPARTGKSNLDDLRDGKPTALLALTVAAAGDDGRQLLAELVGRSGLDGEEAAAVRELMEACGARQQVEDMIRERIDRAVAALDAVPMPAEARSALGQLAGTAAERSL